MASESIDVAIADNIVALLTANAAELPASTTAERRLFPIYSTAQLATLKIAVAPRKQTRGLASRSASHREHAVQIAPHLVATHDAAGQVDEAALAAFVGVVETIADIIERAAAAAHSFAGCTFLRLATEPLYDPDQLQSPGVMRAVITCEFKRIAKPPTI